MFLQFCYALRSLSNRRSLAWNRSSKGVNSAGHGHSSSPRAVFNPLDVESADDRLAGTAWGDGISTNSDWLLGGETARVGMADSIIAENSGRRGATVVREGSFQSSLLRPSQVHRVPVAP